MKTNAFIFVAAGLLLVSFQSLLAQGFVNLNFESANIISIAGSPYYPYGIETTNALPGWAVYYGGNQVNQITYNSPAVGSTWVSLLATNGQQISGNYSVLLQGGITASAATISQNGLVPISSQSLTFQAYRPPGTPVGSLFVSLGGQNLNYFAISSGANYTLFGANIAAFAGQSELLAFSTPQGQFNFWTIDNIQFSSSPIPEPSALGLIGVSILFLAWRRRNDLSV